MFRFLTVLSFGFLALPLAAQPDKAPANFVFETPNGPATRIERPIDPIAQIEADLKGFADELNGTQSFGSRYVVGARFGYFGADEWFQEWKRLSSPQKLEIVDVGVEEIDAENATVRVDYRWRPANGAGELGKTQQETLQLKLQKIDVQDAVHRVQNGLWGIVIGHDDEVMKKPDSLEFLAFFTSQEPGSLPLVRQYMATYRLKRLALATMQFSQDWDEIFRFDGEHWPEALRPYTKDERVFEVPGTREKWRFNEKLSNQSLAAINEAAQTVLFHDGDDEKLNFRGNEVSPVCFTDGHVELVTRQKAGNLRWIP